jgi:hypothetical protein
MLEKKPPTHKAYALKREGRSVFRWLEIGDARIESGGPGTHHVYLDRLPVGGFGGHVILLPIGVAPPDPDPQRPDDGTEQNGL